MANKETAQNIVYTDYRTSSIETGYYSSSAKPDSISNIIKNSIIIIENNDKKQN